LAGQSADLDQIVANTPCSHQIVARSSRCRQKLTVTAVSGARVEVKSAAYLQSWYQKRFSWITFSMRKTLAWDPDTEKFAAVAQRHAQAYMFALLAHTDKPTVNPLDLDQWTFYVLPTAVLDARTRSQDSITLKTLQELTTATIFGGLEKL
jgi:hypothetical protein